MQPALAPMQPILDRRFLAAAPLLVPLLLVPLLLVPLMPSAALADDSAPRLLQVPTATVGEVREMLVKRIDKKIHDVLGFGGRIRVLRDSDTPPMHMRKKAPVKRPSKAQLKLSDADRLRLEGMDLATAGKHRRAYKKFAGATKIYEQYFYELVDYNNMADAYARAAVSAFLQGQKKGNVKFLFTNAMVIQPTLVIDRRKAPAALLALFDRLHARVKSSKSYAAHISAKGNTQGAVVYIDGQRAGPLVGNQPLRRGGLRNGYHYIMVKSPNHRPWGKQIRIRGKDLKVNARLALIRRKKKGPPPRPLTFADLGWCKNSGNFHDRKCRALNKKIAAQTGAAYLLFSVLKADRYGRMSHHSFLYRARKGVLVSIPPIELGKNMRNLNAKMPGLEEQVSSRIAKFPTRRALKKRPRVFDH